MILRDLFQNQLLMSAILSWLVAQVLKTIIYACQTGKLDWSRLFGDGGMPSGHSATVSALATASAFHYGLGSCQFAISTILAIIVMHDAYGVRLESGKQAHAINEIIQLLKQDILNPSVEKLKELLGHTPIQVTMGAILGVVVALIYCLC